MDKKKPQDPNEPGHRDGVRNEAELQLLEAFRRLSKHQRDALYVTALGLGVGVLTEIADKKPLYEVFPELR